MNINNEYDFIEKKLEEAEELFDQRKDSYPEVCYLIQAGVPLMEILKIIPSHKAALELLKTIYRECIWFFGYYRENNPESGISYPWEYYEEELIDSYHGYINSCLTIMREHPESISDQSFDLLSYVFCKKDKHCLDPYLYYIKCIKDDYKYKILPKNNMSILLSLLNSKKWRKKFSKSSYLPIALDYIKKLKTQNSSETILWEDQFGDSIPFYPGEIRLKEIKSSKTKTGGHVWINNQTVPYGLPHQHFKAILILAKKATEKAGISKKIKDMEVNFEELEIEVLKKVYKDGENIPSRGKDSTGINGVIAQIRTIFEKTDLDRNRIIYGGKKKGFYRLNFYPERIIIED